MGETGQHPVREIVYLLCRRHRHITILTTLCLAVAASYNLAHGPSYTASIRVLVTANAGEASSAEVAPDHGQTARNQAELLADPGLIRRLLPRLQALPHATEGTLVGRLADHFGPAWRERAVRLGLLGASDPDQLLAARLSAALRVAAIGDTDVLRLDFTWPDRLFAAGALNLIVSGYQAAVADDDHARQAWHQAETALSEAQSQLAALDTRLAAAAPGEDADAWRRDVATTQGRLAAARAAADGARLDRELARRKMDAVDQSFHTGGWVDSPDAKDNPSGIPALVQSFVRLLDQRQALLARLPPDSPKVRAVDQQISRVREENYRAVKEVLSARMTALDERLAQITAGIADDEGKLAALDTRLSEVAVLGQTRAAQAANAAEARRQAEAARRRIDPAWVEVGSTRVLSDAAPPAEPDWPGPALVLEAAILSGLAFGVVSAAVAEKTRRTIDRPVDIARHLNLEVLARLETYQWRPSRLP